VKEDVALANVVIAGG